MASESYVLVVGAAAVDIKGMPPEALVANASNPGVVKYSYGGVARNIAENLGRLEVNVILLSALGLDASGESIMQHCESSGVIMDHVRRPPNARTGTYLSILDHTGDLALAVSDFDIMQYVDPAYLMEKRALFAGARMIVADLNLSVDALEKLLDLADAARVPVAVDPTSPVRAKKLHDYLDRLYLVVPNAAETTTLCGLKIPAHDLESAVQAANHLRSMGTQIAIVTLGENGLAYAQTGNRGHISAPHTRVVDSTGAGDALTAGVIYGLVHDMPLDDAMRLGVTAASLTLQCEESVSPLLTPDFLYNSLVV